MKRLFVFSLALCLLLCGCTIVIESGAPAQTTAPAVTTPVDSEPTAEPTVLATEPAEPEYVSVYLLEQTILFDSGHMDYSYDENYNLESCVVYTIENDIMYTTTYGEKDANGMPCKEEGHGETYILTWSEDGKLQEVQYDTNFSGVQYQYDQQGRLTEKREYYNGMLEGTLYLEYDEEKLIYGCYRDLNDVKCYEYMVDLGRIVQKVFYNEAGGVDYSYIYYYDNDVMSKSEFVYEGETSPCETLVYKEVVVEASRAKYLIEQQKYILGMP